MKRIVSMATLWLCVGLVASAAAGADTSAGQRATDEQEQRVVAFVETHQPELAAVLAHLKKRKPSDYARAIEELDRSVQPLTSGRTKDPSLHELELRAWQARTRVELLGARLLAEKKGKGKQLGDLERELREAISAELDIRAEQLACRKQRSMAWYDRQLNRLATKRDEAIDARLKSLLD